MSKLETRGYILLAGMFGSLSELWAPILLYYYLDQIALSFLHFNFVIL